MREEKRTVLCPIPIAENSELVQVVRVVIEQLLARQNRNGSWGRHSTLDKLISTCHVTMLLLAAGLSPSSHALRKARVWLSGPEVSRHNNSYWILGPFGAWAEAREGIWQREIEKLRRAMNAGAQPHPDQYVEAFFLRVLHAIRAEYDPNLLQPYLHRIRSEWSAERGWAQRADTTTACYAALCVYDQPLAQALRERVIQLMEMWAQKPSDEHVAWLSPISTAYTIMNIVECELDEDPRIAFLVEKATKWLLDLRGDGWSWSSENPFGGTGDIKSIEYPTSAVCRALVARLASQDVSCRAAVAESRYLVARGKVRFCRLIALASIGSILMAASFDLLGPATRIVAAVVGQITLEVAAFSVGLLSLAVAVVQIFFPEMGRNILIWFKRQS